ncbi:MAG: hypothetical protein M1839_004549 [Geoglossum umbratile]|nr:MAG: hypothetical protein M1839_004549 [Geoglossum umbratile]
MKEYTPDEKYVLKVGRSERDLSSGEGYLYSSGTSIHAPRSNLPASTSLLQTGRRDAQTPEEKDGEQLVRRLLVFQSFDGSFQANRVHELEQLLGESFISFTSHLVTETVSLESAVTAAIVALLEETFQFCKDLWVMMVTKAKEYLANAAAPSSLLTHAKELLKKLPTNPNPDTLSSSPPAPSPATACTNFPSPTPPDPVTGDQADSSQTSLWATSSDTVQLARSKRFSLHRASMFSIPSAPTPSHNPTTASTNFPSPTLPNSGTGNQADSSYPNLWANSNETAQLAGTERSKQLRAISSSRWGPTPSQSITRGTMAPSLDCGVSSGSTTDEIHLTKPQPPHQANKTPAIVGSPSQKLTTGLYGNRGGSIGRRVILDTVPADDGDI